MLNIVNHVWAKFMLNVNVGALVANYYDVI